MLFRTRQTYFESGDKTGKLLANYIKHKECSSIIPSVRSSRGDIFTTATDINNTFKEFYIDLYKSASSSLTDEDISRFLEPLDLPKLSNEQKQLLDSDITLEEVIEVIRALPTGKAPGPDGFPTDFFKEHAKDLAPLMLEVFMEAFQREELPPTMSQALISLILKKDKDPIDCKKLPPNITDST